MPRKKAFKLKLHQKALLAMAFLLFVGLVSVEVSNFLSKEGYTKADVIEVDGNQIVVGSGCTAIIADTSQERADSIQLGLEGRIDERPNAHDLFVDAFDSFNITVDSVTMDKYDGKYYYSTIVLTDGKKVLKLDSRPSDAIAIALRAGAPIYVNRTLLDEQGENIC
jgi:bifunctional DNase/RNase